MTTNLTVSDVAVSQARQCGIMGDTASRVLGLARSAVSTQHEVGNLVYGPYVMLVTGGVVRSFTMIGPRLRSKRAPHECKLCDGYMVVVVDKRIKGGQGRAAHPCPRAFDPEAPLCDEKLKRTPPR